MTTKSRFTTAIATGAVLLNAFAPMAFASSVTVSGNGALSNNTVSLSNTSTTSVSQTNTALVTNTVTSNASSGGNSANFNTGGTTAIVTGNATNTVDVATAANLNKVSFDTCNGCSAGAGTNVTIAGNGAISDNTVDVSNTSTQTLNQLNTANVTNTIDADARTGGNDAGFNVGDALIFTGNASSDVHVGNALNANVASLGGSTPGAVTGSSLAISGNGALSNNSVSFLNSSAVVLGQTNTAVVTNLIDSDAHSGNNSADFNTGGDVTVQTGSAHAKAKVHNLVNFNAADLDCGCVLGGTSVSVSGNGADSLNTVTADNAHGQYITSANIAVLLNDIESDGRSGGNTADFNTGDTGSKTVVMTGASSSMTEVSNGGNVNLFNSDGAVSLPNFEIDFDFDLLGLMSLFHFMG